MLIWCPFNALGRPDVDLDNVRCATATSTSCISPEKSQQVPRHNRMPTTQAEEPLARPLQQRAQQQDTQRHGRYLAQALQLACELSPNDKVRPSAIPHNIAIIIPACATCRRQLLGAQLKAYADHGRASLPCLHRSHALQLHPAQMHANPHTDCLHTESHDPHQWLGVWCRRTKRDDHYIVTLNNTSPRPQLRLQLS